MDNINKLYKYLHNKDERFVFQTFKDLDLKDVYTKINYTNSKIGEQYLYNILIHLKNNYSELDKFEEKIITTKESRNEDFLRKKISVLNKNRSYNLVDMVFSKWLHLPYWWYKKSPILVFLLLICVFGFTISPSIFIYPVIILPSVFLIFHLINKGIVFYTYQFFQNLYDFISVITVINEKTTLYNFKSQDHYKGYSFLINILLINEKLENKNMFSGTISFVIDLFKGFFMIDILIITYLQRKITFNKDLKSDFLKLGELDTILSIIELRNKGNVCIPVYKKNSLSTTSITHPIIENCIPNSINTLGKSALITGANMSGKTTFIKSIGVNLILARSINTCFAKSFTFDFYDVFTSINIVQDLKNKKSYFKAEVDVMKNIVEISTVKKSLIIIDEIFKGTNTIERVALGFSILEYLSNNKNYVFVSTHDIELVNLLKKTFKQFHFDFSIKNNDITYDYKIKKGAILHNYALQLIKQNEFPIKIINNAEKIINNEKK